MVGSAWRRLLLLAAAAALVAGGLLTAPSASSTPPAKKLQAKDFRFCNIAAKFCTKRNFTISVPVGTTVTWYYEDKVCDRISGCPGHNVVIGATYGNITKKDGAVMLSMTFLKKGTFTYFCEPHDSLGMNGTITVT